MYATEKQNRGSDCSLIVVSLTTENNRIIHIRKAVAFSDFTFLLQTSCNLLYIAGGRLITLLQMQPKQLAAENMQPKEGKCMHSERPQMETCHSEITHALHLQTIPT